MLCSLPSEQLRSLLTRFLEDPLISDNAQSALASWQQERNYSVESLTSDMVERCMQEQLVVSGDLYDDNPIAEDQVEALQKSCLKLLTNGLKTTSSSVVLN